MGEISADGESFIKFNIIQIQMATAGDSKPVVKATDMEQEELLKVTELVDLALKESVKELKQ